MKLIKRNIEHKINRLLGIFPVVALIGARQTGKTVLAQKVRPEWRYFDLEKPDDFDLISRDPVLFFEQFPSNIILDEAQSYPKIFEILRGVIDQQRQRKGRFIITGSSSPELLKQISESLTGRIATVEIGTLKANEYYQKPLSNFYKIFENPISKKNLPTIDNSFSREEMQKVWVQGGYPEPTVLLKQNEVNLWMESYRDSYIHRDISRLFPRLDTNKYQRFINMLAKLSGTIVNKNELGRALEINESTAREYLYIADKTFIWRELLSYEKDTIKSIVKMPKGYIRDSGLLHFLLRISNFEQLLLDPIIGKSFESFVIEEILKGLESTLVTNWQPYYFRTRGGAEIDLILEGPFGILPIEIKYSTNVKLKQLTSLTQFIDRNSLPFGILVNQGKESLWLTDKILQIPVGWI